MSAPSNQAKSQILDCYKRIVSKGLLIGAVTLLALFVTDWAANAIQVEFLKFLSIPIGVVGIGTLLYCVIPHIRELERAVDAKREASGEKRGDRFV